MGALANGEWNPRYVFVCVCVSVCMRVCYKAKHRHMDHVLQGYDF